MSFLLDTNICSAHMRRPTGLYHRFTQYAGRLYTTSIVLAELYAGVYLLPNPQKRLAELLDLLSTIKVMDFGEAEAKAFGQIRAELKPKGKTVNALDLLIGAAALANDFTLVTHNTKHFLDIPGLRIEDWLAD